MTPLPNDCARCMSAEGCHLASTCRSTTPLRSGTIATMQHFPGGKDCPGYWPEQGRE